MNSTDDMYPKATKRMPNVVPNAGLNAVGLNAHGRRKNANRVAVITVATVTRKATSVVVETPPS